MANATGPEPAPPRSTTRSAVLAGIGSLIRTEFGSETPPELLSRSVYSTIAPGMRFCEPTGVQVAALPGVVQLTGSVIAAETLVNE